MLSEADIKKAIDKIDIDTNGDNTVAVVPKKIWLDMIGVFDNNAALRADNERLNKELAAAAERIDFKIEWE